MFVGILLSAGLKGLLSAFGFDIPSSGIVLKPGTVIISLVVGTVVSFVSAVVPARRAARVPPIAAMRDVAVERALGTPGAGSSSGSPSSGSASRRCSPACSGSSGIQFVGIGVFLIFIGVFVLGPVIARRASMIIGAPLPRLRGMPGMLARQNAMRNPKRTSATAAALMIGVALVSFITVFAESTKASINTQIDNAFSADFVISTGGFGSFDAGFSGTLAEEVADLPEVGASTPLRFNEAEFDGSGQFFAAFDPSTVTELFDLGRIQGSMDDLADGGIAVSREEAKDEKWRLGTDVPVRFPSGATTLPIVAIYGTGAKEGLSDFAMSIATFNEHYTTQLDQQVYVKLADGVSTDQGRRVLERAIKPYPNAELQDQSEFKEAQADQINQLLNLIYVLLAAGRRHRPHRHREHAGALDLRAHPRARAAARRRHDPRPAAVGDPLGVGDHRPARHVPRSDRRPVLRVGGRRGAEGRGHLRVRAAGWPAPDRRRRRGARRRTRRRWRRRGGPPSSTCCRRCRRSRR